MTLIRLESIASWFIMVILLVLLPEESRLLLFDTRAQDWYGEVLLSSPERTLLLAKNASAGTIDIGEQKVTSMIVLQAEQEEALLLGAVSELPPKSISVVEIDGSISSQTRRNAVLRFNGGEVSRPGKLSVMTRSDLRFSYILGAIIIGLFMLLGFVMAAYGQSKVPEKADR